VAAHAEGTRQRIIGVGTRLFYERGYHGTSVRQIAAGLDMGTGSLYNHFSSKQELLLTICLDAADALYEGAVPRIEAQTGAEARLRALVTWHVEFHAKNRLAAMVADEHLHALVPSNRRQVEGRRERQAELLRSVLAEGREELGWQFDDETAITFGITTMCTQVDTWYREGGRLQPSEIAATFADFILRGLGGRSAPPVL
jgi:AcrR family transcriptional regulator